MVFFSRSIERRICFAFMWVSIAGSCSLSISRAACLHRFHAGFDHGALQFADSICTDLCSLLHRLTSMFC